jgi:hypothetical protein
VDDINICLPEMFSGIGIGLVAGQLEERLAGALHLVIVASADARISA